MPWEELVQECKTLAPPVLGLRVARELSSPGIVGVEFLVPFARERT